LRGLGQPVEGDLNALQDTLRTRADIRYVPGLEQPATFGVFRPVVLLPDTVREQPHGIQQALVAHELVHVQRRDWLWVLGEELLLAGFWFNPGIWWIVANVRRAREESVDELAILATGSRRTYVKALLAFAGTEALAPAPAFADRRHLFKRITLISREAVMSSNRIVLSCAVMAMIVLAGGWYAASAFPLIEQSPILQQEGPGPYEQKAKPAGRDNPVPTRTDYQAADYPAEARTAGVSGTISLRVTVDEVGRVVEARRTAFALEVVSPRITARFTNTSPDAMRDALQRSHPNAAVDSILSALEALTNAASHAVSQWRFDPPSNGPVAFDVAIHFKADGETTARVAAPVVGSVASHALFNPEGAVRVGGNIKAPTKIKDVRPVYPLVAMQARVSGMVIVEARIGPDGSVEAARVLRSIPLLDQAALDAVYQWKFTPTLLNGVPTPVIMTVTVNFTIQ
jgi:TonB family protein